MQVELRSDDCERTRVIIFHNKNICHPYAMWARVMPYWKRLFSIRVLKRAGVGAGLHSNQAEAKINRKPGPANDRWNQVCLQLIWNKYLLSHRPVPNRFDTYVLRKQMIQCLSAKHPSKKQNLFIHYYIYICMKCFFFFLCFWFPELRACRLSAHLNLMTLWAWLWAPLQDR